MELAISIFANAMSSIRLLACLLLLLFGRVGAQNVSARSDVWSEVYEDYVCGTSDGYMWLADACTFPFRTALDYYIRYGESTNDMYNAQDYTFNDIPLYQLNENDTIDTYLYDYSRVFSFSEDRICTDYVTMARTCMTHYYTNCTTDMSSSIVDSYLTTYQDQFCDTDALKPFITNQRGVLEQFLSGNTRRAECSGLSEFYDSLTNQSVCTQNLILTSPYAIDRYNITEYTESEPEGFLEFRSNYATELKGALRCVAVKLREMGCPTSEAQSLLIAMYGGMVPPGVDVSLEEIAQVFRGDEANELATGDESDFSRQQVGAYGYGMLLPASRLDDTDRSICELSPQWQTLLHNSYVRIDAFSTLEPATDYGATFFSSIEVTVSDGAGSTLMEYSAANGQLGINSYQTLDDKTSVLQTLSDSQISIRELDTNLIQITNPADDTAITIGNYGQQYGVFVSAYETNLERSYGVLVDGCAGLDTSVIPGYTASRRRRRSIESCQTACQQLSEVHRNGCNFACSVNGGDADQAVGSSLMAAEAEQESTSSDSAFVIGLSHSKAARQTPCDVTLLFGTFLLSLVTYFRLENA